MTTLLEGHQFIESRLEDLNVWAIAIKQHKSHENAFVVLAYRPETDDYITWDGYADGVYPARLSTGHYDMDYEEAMMDFEARGR